MVSLAPDTQHEIKALPMKKATLCLDIGVSKALTTLSGTGVVVSGRKLSLLRLHMKESL